MRIFRRHASHSYQGYHFPWYVTLLWMAAFVAGVIYLVRYLILSGNAGS